MLGKEKPGRIGVAILAGGDDEESETSPADMACNAVWSAIKEDDKEGFKDAFKEYVKLSMDAAKKPAESDDY